MDNCQDILNKKYRIFFTYWVYGDSEFNADIATPKLGVAIGILLDGRVIRTTTMRKPGEQHSKKLGRGQLFRKLAHYEKYLKRWQNNYAKDLAAKTAAKEELATLDPEASSDSANRYKKLSTRINREFTHGNRYLREREDAARAAVTQTEWEKKIQETQLVVLQKIYVDAELTAWEKKLLDLHERKFEMEQEMVEV